MKSLPAVRVQPTGNGTVPVLGLGQYCVLGDLVHCKAPDGTLFACTMSGGAFRPDPEIVKNRDGTFTIRTMPWGACAGENYRAYPGKLVKDVWQWESSEY